MRACGVPAPSLNSTRCQVKSRLDVQCSTLTAFCPTDDEESDSSTPPSSPPVTAVRRRQFDDEEDDSDVLDSWDAAEDSEVEREKEKKATEAKAKAAAEAAANKKPKSERRAEHIAARKALAEDSESEEEETEADRRQRLRATEKAADLSHAHDLFDDFGDIGVPKGRKAVNPGAAVALDGSDPNDTVNLADLPLFKPNTKKQFETLRETLAPILLASGKKSHYTIFLQEFAKQLAADLPSDQVKKISSSLTALGNQKMKQEKTAEKGGKKTKAAKTKTSLVGTRQNDDDFAAYNNDNDDAFGDDDFM